MTDEEVREESGEMTINQLLAIIGALGIIITVVWYVKLASLKLMVKRSNRHRNE